MGGSCHDSALREQQRRIKCHLNKQGKPGSTTYELPSILAYHVKNCPYTTEGSFDGDNLLKHIQQPASGLDFPDDKGTWTATLTQIKQKKLGCASVNRPRSAHTTTQTPSETR